MVIICLHMYHCAAAGRGITTSLIESGKHIFIQSHRALLLA